MKKYGDDADQFHNQGTRVELSKKWHEQHQLRHDYSYRSPSRSNSTYKSGSSYKYDSNHKKSSKSTYKSVSSYKYDSNHKRISNSTYRTGRMLKKCPKCGNLIPSTEKICSYCNNYIELEDKPKSSSTHKNKSSNTYKHDPHEWIFCSKCGHQYDSQFDSCPYCKSKSRSTLSYSLKLIIVLFLAFILLIFLIMLQ